MWIRKRIDIGWFELFRAFIYCLTKFKTTDRQEQLGCPDLIEVLSVRSGFHLLLDSMKWQDGSEIIFSGLTIADMPRIACEHGLNVRVVDIDLNTLGPSVHDVKELVNSNTKAIVVAHLMGGRNQIEGLARLARDNNLMLIEDCAQAWVGKSWQGSPEAEVSLFSFGSIKTNTALGGGIMKVRNEKLLLRLKKQHSSWPAQSRMSYFLRIVKYSGIKLASSWIFSFVLCWFLRRNGKSHDPVIAGLARGFSKRNFFEQICRQPSNPLREFVNYRIAKSCEAGISRRKSRGHRVISQISRSGTVIGKDQIEPSHWVFPILVANREQVLQTLWKQGFDATGRSSLVSVAEDPEFETPNVDLFLNSVVFLPIEYPMPNREIGRLATSFNGVAKPVANLPTRTHFSDRQEQEKLSTA